jgi:chromosome segregation ATPase
MPNLEKEIDKLNAEMRAATAARNRLLRRSDTLVARSRACQNEAAQIARRISQLEASRDALVYSQAHPDA